MSHFLKTIPVRFSASAMVILPDFTMTDTVITSDLAAITVTVSQIAQSACWRLGVPRGLRRFVPAAAAGGGACRGVLADPGRGRGALWRAGAAAGARAAGSCFAGAGAWAGLSRAARACGGVRQGRARRGRA